MKKNTLLLAASVLCLSACDPMVQTRGHVKDPEWKTTIQPGSSSREEVLAALGSPSTRSSFGPETWYYITTRRENYAFFKPEITDQDVVAVRFDQFGLVDSIEEAGKEKLQDIKYSKRETPTEGHELGLMEQLLGNMGRFNRPESSSTRGMGSNRPGGR